MCRIRFVEIKKRYNPKCIVKQTVLQELFQIFGD